MVVAQVRLISVILNIFTDIFLYFAGGEAVTMILAVFLIVSLAGSYNITYQLAAELFPTVVRGRGVLLSKVLKYILYFSFYQLSLSMR